MGLGRPSRVAAAALVAAGTAVATPGCTLDFSRDIEITEVAPRRDGGPDGDGATGNFPDRAGRLSADGGFRSARIGDPHTAARVDSVMGHLPGAPDGGLDGGVPDGGDDGGDGLPDAGPTPTATATATATASATPQLTATPSGTATPQPTPTGTGRPTDSPSPSPSPTPTPTPSPTPCLVEPCFAGVSSCRAEGETIACDANGNPIGCDAVPGTPGEEVCDELDNDCDDEVDETCDCRPEEEQACYSGPAATRLVGACEDGAQLCSDDGHYGDCIGDRQPEEEDCNLLDDDCDGVTNETFAGQNESCTEGIGACQRTGVLVCEPGNSEGGVHCNAIPGVPASREICNGVDDDCDGVIDEDANQNCRTECGTGLRICRDGTLQACNAQEPQPDSTCNNTDEDCDNHIDDDVPETACSVGTGECARSGTTLCVEGGVVCDAIAGEPGVETCNGLDDDCDGQIDEDVFQACETACGGGVATCEDGAFVGCTARVPTEEECNGEDDDCDGTTDEGTDLACSSVCENGIQECFAGLMLECNARLPSDEACNDADDDCDGATDEDFDPLTCGTGACANSVAFCVDGDVQTCTPRPAGTETCNRVDDDCDGQTDEGFDPLTCGTGACANTVPACVNGVDQTCTPHNPTAERCNGVDDDCDGATDELADLGTRSCGTGVCENTVNSCVNGVEQTCTPLQGGAEACNELDDDCDGNTDEEFPEAGRCDVGQGACARSGVNLCEDGSVDCSVTPGTPASGEICNGIDDDCDGTTDENYAGEGDCQVGIGACQNVGVTTCEPNNPAGSIQCSATEGASTAEQCNGLDDDCDGFTDENLVEACAANCGGGFSVCEDGVWTGCNAVNPQPEACNGVDDDCDGNIDESLTQICSTACGSGTETCVDSQFVGCDAPPVLAETCNNVDDDCDGSVDENITRSCASACNTGTETCVSGAFVGCDAPQPGTEICNNVDDDCDGQVDEEFARQGQACADGIGACRDIGTFVCQPGSPRGDEHCSAVAHDPELEVCNGVDDDCDGSTDEEFSPTGACTEGRGECARDGVQVCDPGDERGNVYCDAIPGTPTAETCDGLDEDCDGSTDEDLPARNCDNACGSGVETCRAGVYQGCTAPQGSLEVCNGVDDDCDGLTDENFPGEGVACAVGTGACRAEGRMTCFNGAEICNATPGTPTAETCNDVDDDCDGSTNEAFPEQGQTCADGVGACRVEAPMVCENGVVTCSAVAAAPNPEGELCNGLDDDCDGEENEGACSYVYAGCDYPVLQWASVTNGGTFIEDTPNCVPGNFIPLWVRTGTDTHPAERVGSQGSIIIFSNATNRTQTTLHVPRFGVDNVKAASMTLPLPANPNTASFTGVNLNNASEDPWRYEYNHHADRVPAFKIQ